MNSQWSELLLFIFDKEAGIDFLKKYNTNLVYSIYIA